MIIKKVKKPSMGRRKIDIVKIVDKDDRHVTFSKRRAGLFKKASELCILCGAEVAVIVFSPAGRIHSFGHPCVDSVVDRFLDPNSPSDEASSMLQLANTHQAGAGYVEAFNKLEAEKKRVETLQWSMRVDGDSFWWDAPIDNLGLQELEKFKASLEVLRKKVAKRAEELMMRASSASSFLDVNSVGVVDPFVTHTTECNGSIVPYDFGSGCDFFEA